jgi:transcriptional regulator with GAF, ATPase, and Fis domain
LRKRTEDILPIAMMWLNIYRDEFGYQVTDFDDEVKALFQSYDWPTNVDQLQSVIEDAVRYAQRGVITKQHISLRVPYVTEIPALFAKKANLVSDYLEFRRAHTADWKSENEKLNTDAATITQMVLKPKQPLKESFAVFMGRHASEQGWLSIRKTLVARRVIISVFAFRNHKLINSIRRTAELLGYYGEKNIRETKSGDKLPGAFAKYLSDIGLTPDKLMKNSQEDLFPEEIQMVNEVMRVRPAKPR